MAGRTTSTSRTENVVSLKLRIKELEDTVAAYKKRLDDLRKAKNTTILKREREVINMAAPQLGVRRDSVSRDDTPKVTELERQLELLKLKHEEVLKEAASNEDNMIVGNEEELCRLRRRISELENENAVLIINNDELSERVSSLIGELSVKEAQWCEQEEKINLKMKEKWQEMYAEWMAKTEAKLAELNQANSLLKSMLQHQRPHGGDPSQQDMN